MASGWSCPLNHWNWWTGGKPVGSNSGTLWSISARQKPIAAAPSWTQAQPGPSLPAAAATCSAHTEAVAGAQQALGAQDPAWDSLNEALVPFSPVVILELWSPLLILTQTWEWKTWQGTGNFAMWAERMWRLLLCSSSSENSARKERIETA